MMKSCLYCAHSLHPNRWTAINVSPTPIDGLSRHCPNCYVWTDPGGHRANYKPQDWYVRVGAIFTKLPYQDPPPLLLVYFDQRVMLVNRDTGHWHVQPSDPLPPGSTIGRTGHIWVTVPVVLDLLKCFSVAQIKGWPEQVLHPPSPKIPMRCTLETPHLVQRKGCLIRP